MPIIAALLVGLAVFVGVHGVLARRGAGTASRLAQIAGTTDALNAQPGVGERVVRPLAGGMADLSSAMLPMRLNEHFTARLAMAGGPLTPGAFLAFLIVAPSGLALLAFSLMQRSGASPLLIPFFALFGLAAPIVWLSGRVGRRQKQVNRELPDVLDLIVVSVEAGLGLEGAIARITDHADGPLAEELRRVLSEMNLGLGRRRALQGLAARTAVPAITSLVSAILQAEQTGMGIGHVLRAQSEHLRTVRRQAAEEAAMKAPLKMLFPVVMFIFPSLFVVVLGPAVISLMKVLGGE